MIVRSIAILILLILTGCTTSVLAPPRELVQQAIALQLEKTQQQLNQQLDLKFRGFEINHLLIKQQQALTIQGLPTYHIFGTYDLTFKLPKQSLKQLQKPYEVYLQIQQEGKTWRMLVPSGEQKDTWRSYLIQ